MNASITKEEALNYYNALSQPPKNMLKEIAAGKLKGKTDINPQWRYKAMTEQFGYCGIGWKYEIQKTWTESGACGEILAFAQVAVYIRNGENWSDPIIGVGGSKLVQIEKGNLVSNDEGFKMAITDAFSTSLKMLGVAADIYAGMWDGAKYKDENEQNPISSQCTTSNANIQNRANNGNELTNIINQFGPQLNVPMQNGNNYLNYLIQVADRNNPGELAQVIPQVKGFLRIN